MDPGIAELEALLATATARLIRSHEIQMSAALGHETRKDDPGYDDKGSTEREQGAWAFGIVRAVTYASEILWFSYGTSCSLVLNKKGPLNSVMSPAFLPATGCKRADKGLCHFHASDATSPKMRAN